MLQAVLAAGTVSKISFSGNELTRDKILAREIQHPIGIPLDSTIISKDRDRLENLNLFSMVNWQAYELPDSTLEVRFFLIETWRFLPGLAPVYDENTGWSVSGLLMVNNFRGLNQSLQFSGIAGGITSYAVSFYDPWIAGDHVSLRTEYRNEKFRHYFFENDQRIVSADLQVGKTFSYRHRWLARGYVEESSFLEGDSTVASFNFASPTLSYSYDSRDIYSSPSSGLLISLSGSAGLPFDGKNRFYSKWSASFSSYRKITGDKHKLIAAANFKTNLRTGYRDDFLVDYLGGAYTVRGWAPPDRKTYADPANSFRFGFHSAILSLELRQTIIPKTVTEMRNEFGLTAALFIESGIISEEVEKLLGKAPISGIGIGIRIPSPMLGQLRLDYGWGYYQGKLYGSRFHLAFGQSF